MTSRHVFIVLNVMQVIVLCPQKFGDQLKVLGHWERTSIEADGMSWKLLIYFLREFINIITNI